MEAEDSKRYVAGLAATDIRPDEQATLVGSTNGEATPLEPLVLAETPVIASAASASEATDARGSETGAESLFLSAAEISFMREMAPFIGHSPRRGIRFVNVYRLIKTGLRDFSPETFIGLNGDRLAFRALLTQLAIVTGAPKIASAYFQHQPKEEQHNVTLCSLREKLKEDPLLIGSPEWAAVDGALQRLYDLNVAANLDTGVALVTALRDMAPIAARYSFASRRW